MPPKFRVNKTFPGIEKGCKAVAQKPKETVRNTRRIKKAPPPVAMHLNNTPLVRLQRNATRNIQLIREEKEALRINKRLDELMIANVERKTLHILYEFDRIHKTVDDHTRATNIMSKVNATKVKANAAATRHKIIGRIKGARAWKTLPVH